MLQSINILNCLLHLVPYFSALLGRLYSAPSVHYKGWVGVEDPLVGSVVLCARAGLRTRAKLVYLHTHPHSGPGLNRWFLFFLADLWQSHKRPLLWHEAKRLRPLLAGAEEGGENRGELSWGGRGPSVEESREGGIKSQQRITMDSQTWIQPYPVRKNTLNKSLSS